MLNPIKTPKEMLMDQANIPHFDVGGMVKRIGEPLFKQFEQRIREAIRRYTQSTGKAPTPQEVAALEDHIRSLSQKAPETPVTKARALAETPAADKLVDARGRPYSTMPDPRTGKPTTPERAQGYTTKDQFAMDPANIAARKEAYGPAWENVFGEDPFMSLANTGRLPSQTWKKSYTPSVEELSSRELMPSASMDDEIGGLSRIQATEGDVPMPQKSQIAETATALEAPFADKISTEIMRGQHAGLVKEVIEEFKQRGIQPDEEDIINGVVAKINPMRHNYTGRNPLPDRPSPPRGRPSLAAEAAMNRWRDEARASGVPEYAVTEHPDSWRGKQRDDYLLDTEPERRAPFAKNWKLEGYAEGGHLSTRDMQAEMMVGGYAGGGKIKREYGPGRAILQGASMNWADEGEAKLRSLFGGASYDEELAALQAAKAQYEQENPKLANALELGGSLAGMLIPGMGLARIPKAAQMMNRMARTAPITSGAGIGAVQGGLESAGRANPGERMLEGAVGAIGGAGLGAGFGLGVKGINKARDMYRRYRGVEY